MVQRIKNFFKKRSLNKRIEVTRKQFNRIKDRDISARHKTKLAYTYLKKIHALQREISALEVS